MVVKGGGASVLSGLCTLLEIDRYSAKVSAWKADLSVTSVLTFCLLQGWLGKS